MHNKNILIIAILIITNIVFIAGLVIGNGVYSFSRDHAVVFRYNKLTGSIFLCKPKQECIPYEPLVFDESDFTEINDSEITIIKE